MNEKGKIKNKKSAENEAWALCNFELLKLEK